jgi:hypothetical protein
MVPESTYYMGQSMSCLGSHRWDLRSIHCQSHVWLALHKLYRLQRGCIVQLVRRALVAGPALDACRKPVHTGLGPSLPGVHACMDNCCHLLHHVVVVVRATGIHSRSCYASKRAAAEPHLHSDSQAAGLHCSSSQQPATAPAAGVLLPCWCKQALK